MGKNSTPQYNAPAPPTLKTADQLYGAATQYAQNNMPNAYGAREGALNDLKNPTAYYSGFQPTSLESAIGNQYFSNIWPDVQSGIKHNLSLSGLDSSPLLAQQSAKAQGNLETGIGQYLSDQANTRATNSLNSRLGVDPNNVLSGYLSTDKNQSNSQDALNYDYQQQLAQIAYQKAIQDANQKSSGISSAFGLGGAGLAALLAIPTGGMSLAALPGILGAGSSAGSMLAPLFGGQAPSSGSTSNLFGSGGGLESILKLLTSSGGGGGNNVGGGSEASAVNPWQLSGSQGSQGNYFGH